MSTQSQSTAPEPPAEGAKAPASARTSTRAHRRPTLQAWVGMQPAWMLTSEYFPHQRMAVYACVPVGALIALCAGKLKLGRMPTALSILAAIVSYGAIGQSGAHKIVVVVFTQAHDKFIVSSAMAALYTGMELRAWLTETLKRLTKSFIDTISQPLAVSLVAALVPASASAQPAIEPDGEAGGALGGPELGATVPAPSRPGRPDPTASL